MKPNGQNVIVRNVFFAMCAVLSLLTIGSAETARGTFKLPMQARWGEIVLAPGEYEFTIQTESSGRIVMIRSRDSGLSGIVMSEGFSTLGSKAQSRLGLGKAEGVIYVRELCLSDLGIALEFAPPGPGKVMALVKPKTATTRSASGLQ